jgi:hypothetical protein
MKDGDSRQIFLPHRRRQVFDYSIEQLFNLAA